MSLARAEACQTLQVEPLREPLLGEYSPPADHSVACVALCCAALCPEGLLIRGQLPASVDKLLGALEALGMVAQPQDDSLRLSGGEGLGQSRLSTPLDPGDDEEGLLLLCGLCCGLGLELNLALPAGGASAGLKAGLESLRQLGAQIEPLPDASGTGQRELLRLGGARPGGGNIELAGTPPWLNAALLLAALAAGAPLTLREPRNAHDHIYRLLRSLGAEIYHSSEGVSLPEGQRLIGGELKLPGCPDAAAGRALSALLLSGSDLKIAQVSMNPRRAMLLKLLHECAPAQREGLPGLARTKSWQFGHEPVAALRAVFCQRIRSCIILPNRAALMAAELPWLLLLAAHCRGVSVLRGFDGIGGSGSLRGAYVAELLRSFGVDAEYEHDGWRITGPTQLLAAEVQCAGDPQLSRLALLLARFADGPSTLHAALPEADPLAWAGGGPQA